MMARDDRRQPLIEEALSWRVPTVDELNKPLGSIRLDSLRIATDAKRTEQLIAAGVATRFQRRTHVPRKDGRKLPTVVQLHPEGAPRNGPASRTRAYRAPQAVRPSVEELRALLERIEIVERELQGEKTRAINERIASTKRRLIDLAGDAEAAAIRELHELTEARRSMSASIRRDTFARIDGDDGFAPRRWLALLSLERES